MTILRASMLVLLVSALTACGDIDQEFVEEDVATSEQASPTQPSSASRVRQ